MDEERTIPVEAPDAELPDEEDTLGAKPEEALMDVAEDEPPAEELHDGPPEDDAEEPGARCCPSMQCQYDKHEPDANFCILCGTLLFTHCEDCLGSSAPYARFCRLCGADLDELRAERAASE